MNRLRHYRLSRDLTQVRLGAKVHIKQNVIAQLEIGYRLPYPYEAKALAAYFGVKVEALFPEGTKNPYERPLPEDAPVLAPPPPPGPSYPRGDFVVMCAKCKEHFTLRADDRHSPFDAELECPSCSMPVRDIIQIMEGADAR